MTIEDGSGKHLFIKHLIASIRCSVCHHLYEPDDIYVIDHRDDLWVMAVVCTQCQTRGLIFAIIREISKDEFLTELTPEEWERFQEMPDIETDDVLDVHKFLRDFSGDLEDLLREGIS